MLYLQKNQQNTLVLNINNNSRDTFTTYDLIFTHIMSKEVKTYTVDLTNPNQYFQNIRYCTITLDFTANDLNYEGQYQLNIYGQPNNKLVFIGMVVLEGTAESNPFTEYISPNETNENYIYIQEL
jgi:hypothetical protein